MAPGTYAMGAVCVCPAGCAWGAAGGPRLFFCPGHKARGPAPPAGGDTFKGRAPPPFLLMITLLKKVAVKNGMPVLDISLKILKHVYAALPFLIKTK